MGDVSISEGLRLAVAAMNSVYDRLSHYEARYPGATRVVMGDTGETVLQRALALSKIESALTPGRFQDITAFMSQIGGQSSKAGGVVRDELMTILRDYVGYPSHPVHNYLFAIAATSMWGGYNTRDMLLGSDPLLFSNGIFNAGLRIFKRVLTDPQVNFVAALMTLLQIGATVHDQGRPLSMLARTDAQWFIIDVATNRVRAPERVQAVARYLANQDIEPPRMVESTAVRGIVTGLGLDLGAGNSTVSTFDGLQRLLGGTASPMVASSQDVVASTALEGLRTLRTSTYMPREERAAALGKLYQMMRCNTVALERVSLRH